jgi:hypothetical protein
VRERPGRADPSTHRRGYAGRPRHHPPSRPAACGGGFLDEIDGRVAIRRSAERQTAQVQGSSRRATCRCRSPLRLICASSAGGAATSRNGGGARRGPARGPAASAVSLPRVFWSRAARIRSSGMRPQIRLLDSPVFGSATSPKWIAAVVASDRTNAVNESGSGTEDMEIHSTFGNL